MSDPTADKDTVCVNTLRPCCTPQERLPELKRLRQEVIKSSRAASRSNRQYKDRAGMATEVDEQTGAIVPFQGGGQGGGGIR